jgi:hypothetical protein
LIVFLGLFLKSTCREPPACATIAHGRLLRHRADGPPSLHACHARPLRMFYHCCAIQSQFWMSTNAIAIPSVRPLTHEPLRFNLTHGSVVHARERAECSMNN